MSLERPLPENTEALPNNRNRLEEHRSRFEQTSSGKSGSFQNQSDTGINNYGLQRTK
ncbi:hypothetical protein LEMLEM_LOCUS6549, partial [Lemmus lemmus]